MKKIGILFAACFLFAASGQSQIINSTQPETPVAGTVVNTGLAIAPFYHWQAMAYDDPSLSNYTIEWRDDTGILLDVDNQAGHNPDVAYYGNADAVVVAYEDGGNIFVDDYYLSSFVNYNLNANNFVASGINPNVDINSLGNGVLTWEDGGVVYACTFNIGTFTAGPVVPIAGGTNPDIILLDTDSEVIITYERSNGIMVESYLHTDLQSGSATLVNSHFMPPSVTMKQLPRVASQRNSSFGSHKDFTVVAQEDLGGSNYLVWGWFFNGSGAFTAQKVNVGLTNCATFEPKPVVAYERDQVHIAWGQRYTNGCVSSSIGPVLGARDVLMGEFYPAGSMVSQNINGPTTYLQVNQLAFNFMNSATSLSTEYDGNYLINNSNYCEGIIFSDPGDMFWKKRDPAVPVFKTAGDELEDPITIVKAPDLGVIKVTVEGMESDSEVATFTLVDNSGREIQLSPATQSGNTFTLDASSLSNGIYLLNCTVGTRTKTERIAHFK